MLQVVDVVEAAVVVAYVWLVVLVVEVIVEESSNIGLVVAVVREVAVVA